MSAPCGYEAIGQVRVALAAMGLNHQRLMQAASKVPSGVCAGLAVKTGGGKVRAEQRLAAAMPVSPYARYHRAWVWRTLRPRASPLSDEQHDGVEVAALVAGLSRGQAVMRDASWSFFVTLHALARLYERSATRPDFEAAVTAAHDALLTAPADTFAAARTLETRDWTIPCLDGGFRCDVRVVADTFGDCFPMIRARTWMDSSQLCPAWRAQIAAIQFQGQNTNPLGQGLMIPPQLRGYAPAENGVTRLLLSAPQIKPKTRLH